MLENLTEHACIALRNAEVYRAAIVTSERANGLLNMIQSLSQDLGAQSLILTITMHANELVQADRCTVFLVDEKKQQLWSVSTDSGKEIRIPKNAGIVGECVKEAAVIAIPDAYEDSRFNQEIDKKTGYHTKSILAVPLLRKNSSQQVLAVIQMINKTEFDGAIGKFDDEDIQVMETFATFVASKLRARACWRRVQRVAQWRARLGRPSTCQRVLLIGDEIPRSISMDSETPLPSSRARTRTRRKLRILETHDA